jgi:hypothetical protein
MQEDKRKWNIYKFLEEGKLEVFPSRRGITYFKPECNAVLLFDNLTREQAFDIENALIKTLKLEC